MPANVRYYDAMAYISFSGTSEKTPREVLNGALTAAVVDPKNQVIGQSDELLRVSKESRPIWTIVLAILLFPIGLLFLLIKKQQVVTVSAIANGGTTQVTASGEGTSATVDSLSAYLQSVKVVPPDPPDSA